MGIDKISRSAVKFSRVVKDGIYSRVAVVSLPESEDREASFSLGFCGREPQFNDDPAYYAIFTFNAEELWEAAHVLLQLAEIQREFEEEASE